MAYSFGIKGIIFCPIKGRELTIVRFEGAAAFLADCIARNKAPLQTPFYKYWQLLQLLQISMSSKEIEDWHEQSEQTKREFPIYQMLILSIFSTPKQ